MFWPKETLAEVRNGMHEEPRAFFKQAIQNCLPLPKPPDEPYLVWRKVSDSQWAGTVVPRPDIRRALNTIDARIQKAADAFSASFATRHPAFNGMVGFRGNSSNWKDNHARIVQ